MNLRHLVLNEIRIAVIRRIVKDVFMQTGTFSLKTKGDLR